MRSSRQEDDDVRDTCHIYPRRSSPDRVREYRHVPCRANHHRIRHRNDGSADSILSSRHLLLTGPSLIGSGRESLVVQQAIIPQAHVDGVLHSICCADNWCAGHLQHVSGRAALSLMHYLTLRSVYHHVVPKSRSYWWHSFDPRSSLRDCCYTVPFHRSCDLGQGRMKTSLVKLSLPLYYDRECLTLLTPSGVTSPSFLDVESAWHTRG